MAEAASQRLDADAYRDDFPILSRLVQDEQPLVYLDSAATAQSPRQVVEQWEVVYQQVYSNVHRGAHWLSEESTERYELTRESVREFINASSTHEIVFTSGTTAAINLVARSWGDAEIKAGDELLVTQMEHHSNLVPWQQLAERSGAQLKFVPVTDEGQLDLAALDLLLSERTRLVAVTHVSNVLGTINPVKEIVARAKAVDACVLLDAAQSVPHQPVDVQALGVDFLAFSGHKMCGPSGVGVLYGREQLLDKMPPFLGGGSMIHSVTEEGFEVAHLPAKFEAGTPPIVPVIVLKSAIDYLTKIGLERIQQHEAALLSHAHQLLAGVDGLQILGPSPERKGGIVSFVIEGMNPGDLSVLLDQQGMAIRAGHHCAMPLHKRLGIASSCRASFYFYNTLADIERFVEILEKTRQTFG
jgi:cysteine desulfurase/selenocysteine lyase